MNLLEPKKRGHPVVGILFQGMGITDISPDPWLFLPSYSLVVLRSCLRRRKGQPFEQRNNLRTEVGWRTRYRLFTGTEGTVPYVSNEEKRPSLNRGGLVYYETSTSFWFPKEQSFFFFSQDHPNQYPEGYVVVDPLNDWERNERTRGSMD